MGLTSIPTETDNSLGRDKIQKGLPENYAIELPANEYNVAKHAVKGLCDSVGLADGTTQGSLEQLARAINDPIGARPDDFVAIDDFSRLNTKRWTKREVGLGTASIAAGDVDLARSKGAGLLKLFCDTVTDEAGIIDTVKFINGGHSPRVTAFVRPPHKIYDTTPYIDTFTFGLANMWPSPSRYAYIQNAVVESESEESGFTGAWSIYSKSVNPDSETGLGVWVPGQWYTLSIELDADSEIRFYVDGIQIGTLNGINAVPDSADELGCFVNLKCDKSGLTCWVGYIDLRMTRL